MSDETKYLPKLLKEQYDALSPAGKRFALAEDVLAQLNNKLIKGKVNSYIIFNFDDPDDKKAYMDKPAQEVMCGPPAAGMSCHVCALGAGVVSLVRIRNEADLHTISNATNNGWQDQIYDLFTIRHGVLMEMAFEGGDGSNTLLPMTDGTRSYYKWNQAYRDEWRTSDDMPPFDDAIAASNLWPEVAVAHDDYAAHPEECEPLLHERMRLVWQTVLNSKDGLFDVREALKLQPDLTTV